MAADDGGTAFSRRLRRNHRRRTRGELHSYHRTVRMSNVIATSSPAALIPRSKYGAIEAAVVRACDARDGVKDGVASEPKAYAFDPTALQCAGTETDSCLTVSQVTSMKRLYAGLQTTKGALVYPGFVPGGESGTAG